MKIGQPTPFKRDLLTFLAQFNIFLPGLSGLFSFPQKSYSQCFPLKKISPVILHLSRPAQNWSPVLFFTRTNMRASLYEFSHSWVVPIYVIHCTNLSPQTVQLARPSDVVGIFRVNFVTIVPKQIEYSLTTINY